MKFTSKITSYLIAVAIIPPALLTVLFYNQTLTNIENSSKQAAYEKLDELQEFQQSFDENLNLLSQKLINSEELNLLVNRILSKNKKTSQFDLAKFEFDYLEILNSDRVVLYSYHRPGLLGETIGTFSSYKIQYDLNGPHPSRCKHISLPNKNDIIIQTGFYLDNEYQKRANDILGKAASLHFEFDTEVIGRSFSGGDISTGVIYEKDSLYQAFLGGSAESGFITLVDFVIENDQSSLNQTIKISATITLVAVLLAILIGSLITNSAKREIDNLVEASMRISKGDFDSQVIAYSEGEFAQLADAFNVMSLRIKATQKQLATSEKIAAWQTVGRKVAHEIKNPLTPVSVSIDDLNYSYKEKLPDFDKILSSTTQTIKSEIKKMTHLLNRFSSFAEMPPVELKKIKSKEFITEISDFYKHQLAEGRLTISVDKNIPDIITVDNQQLKQVLINLIKNSIESENSTTIQLKITCRDKAVVFLIEDNGDGFSEDKLNNPFEPYATTKKEGSGLGLVICYRIISDHGGSIELYNLEEKGAGVKISLPQQ